jgi:glutamyl-tRNA reductase
MGKTIARRARGLGFEQVTVAVRDVHGRDLPPGADRLVELGEVESLDRVRVVAGCLGDRNGPIHLGELPPADLYVDLGTPANFPATLPNRVTISTLVEDEAPAMAARRAALRERLGELLDRRLAHADHTSASPAGRLRAEIEAIRVREARAIERLHPEIPRATLEAITRRIVNQIFHLPSSRLKEDADDDFGSRVADLFTSSPECRR